MSRKLVMGKQEYENVKKVFKKIFGNKFKIALMQYIGTIFFYILNTPFKDNNCLLKNLKI